MRTSILLFLLASLFAGKAYTKVANEGNIIIHGYQLDRTGLWQTPLVKSSLADAKKINGVLSLNGDISGFEYQLKYASKTAKSTLQTLFYIVDIDDNLSLQVGKFIENWQLGYNANPLNLTDPYHPSDNNDDLNEKLGINAVAIRYINNDISVDLYAGDDDRARDAVRGYGYKSQGMRLGYTLNDDTDISIIAQKKQGVKVGFGAGFRYIANNNSKIYASFFSRKGTALARLNPTTGIINTDRTDDDKRYTRSMLGWHWTGDNNFNVIIELSNDERGMDQSAWEKFNNPALGAAGLALVRPEGLRQYYRFFRLGKIMAQHEVSLSRRLSADNSALNILKWRYDLTQNLQLNTSFSQTSGAPNSEYKTYFPAQTSASIVLRYTTFF